MFPVLLEFGTIAIPTYGFFIALGYLAAMFLARRLAKETQLSVPAISDLCLLLLVTGILGARILFVVINFPYFLKNPQQMLDFRSGGLVFYGGFILAFAAGLLFLQRKKMPLWPTIDLLAPPLALAQAIGRIGCFAAGCCHGSYCPYPWGIELHSSLVEPGLQGQPLHPTQLYESFGLSIICISLLWLRKKNPPTGTIATIYVMFYAILRFFVELFRGDLARGHIPGTNISTSQTIALVLFASSAAIFVRGLRRNN